jgi:hypothetical protein
MNIIPTHLVKHYEKCRAAARQDSTTQLSEQRASAAVILAGAKNNEADYVSMSLRAIDDELAERTDGLRYDLYTEAGKVIQ